jgi:hypothetical protein
MVAVPWDYVGNRSKWDPLAPMIEIELLLPDGPFPITALFDSGADLTQIRYQTMTAAGLQFAACGPYPVDEDDAGNQIWRPFTVLSARLDGHAFRLPVLFRKNDDREINLVGRVGLIDRFAVAHDPQMRHSTFEWRTGPALPQVDLYEGEINAWLEDHPEGYDPAVYG